MTVIRAILATIKALGFGAKVRRYVDGREVPNFRKGEGVMQKQKEPMQKKGQGQQKRQRGPKY